MNPMMSPVRVCEANSREALRRVRAQLGPDALVLSTRRTPSGVELIAIAPRALELMTQGRATPPQANEPALGAEVLGELRELSGRLKAQLGEIGRKGPPTRSPSQAALAQQMTDAGFSAALARQFAERLPDDFGPLQAQSWLRSVLARNLPCADPAGDIVAQGGTFALVGPTGVGKTTTIAKLAARCVVKHGPRSLGLVTTDSYRIGAFDQLRIYGKILGVEVHAANDEVELAEALASLAGRHLVLIDTVGIGQRDARMREQLACLRQPSVRQVLVLSSSSQPEVLDEAAAAFRGDGLEGVVLTKLDEAVKLGGALDTLIRARLPLMAVSNGQRVPEDLHPANAMVLVDRALRAARPAAPSKDTGRARAGDGRDASPRQAGNP